MKLDPTLDESLVLDQEQLVRLQTVYDAEYSEAAAFLEASRRPPSNRNSPVKKPSAASHLSAGNSSTLKKGLNSFAKKSPVGGTRVISEKLRFANIAEEDMRKGMVVRGGEEEFDVLRMFAALEKDFPVHYLMARSALSACETEAHEERVFSFMKAVLGDLRHNMDAEMLEMWVELGFDLYGIWSSP